MSIEPTRIGGPSAVLAQQNIGVANQVESLADSVDALWQSLHRMTDTLDPLLAPPSPVQAMCDRTTVPHALGEKIAQLRDRIDDAKLLIDQLRDRLY